MAELKETMGRASWGPVKVKTEEDEESVVGQASSRQVCAEDSKAWAPGEGPYVSTGVPEEEEKVNGDLRAEEEKRRPQILPQALHCQTQTPFPD